MPVAATARRPLGPTSVRWRILGLLVLASFVAYLLRLTVSVAGPVMAAELGLSHVGLGTVLAAFAWGYALFQIPGGLLGDVFGARRVLALTMAAWGVVNLATGLVPGAGVAAPAAVLLLLVVLRFCMGVVQAPLFPVMAGAAIANWFPRHSRALPNGLASTGLTVGAAVAGPLIALLTARFGWRLAFVVLTPAALGTAWFWWWYARDRPAEHSAVGRAEAEWIARGQAPPVVRAGSWTIVLRNRNVWLLALSYFCMNYVFYIFFNWFVVYLVDVRGFGIVASGFLAAAPWLVGAAAAAAGGLWCDLLCRRVGLRWGCRIPCLSGLGAAAVLVVAGALAEDPYLAVALLAFCFGCTQLTEGAYWSATAAVAGGRGASAAGVLNTAGNLVGGLGALLVPVVADALGWVAALATGSVFALLGAALWLWIRADEVPA